MSCGNLCISSIPFLQQSTCLQVLYPAVSELLAAEEWGRWDATLQRITYDEAEMAAFLEAFEQHKAAAAHRRAEREVFFAERNRAHAEPVGSAK